MRVCVKYEEDIGVIETKSVLCTVDCKKDLSGDVPVYLLNFGDIYEYDPDDPDGGKAPNKRPRQHQQCPVKKQLPGISTGLISLAI